MTEQLNYIIGILIGATMMTQILGAAVLYKGGWKYFFYGRGQSNEIQRFISIALTFCAISYIPGILHYSGIVKELWCRDLYDNLAYVDLSIIPLQALVLMQKRIKFLHWCIMMGPAVFLLLYALFIDQSMSSTLVSLHLAVFIYILVIYIWSLFLLHKWDEQLLENYSDVSHKLTSWFRNLSLPLFVLPLMWIPLFLFPNLRGALGIIYYLLSIFIFVLYVSNVLRHEEIVEKDIHQIAFGKKPEEHHTENVETDNNSEPAWVEKLNEKMSVEKIYLQPDIDSNTLASLIGTNRTYLSKYLNNVKGMTFYDYINSYRLEESMKLLKETDLSVDAISSKCGYRDRVTFYRIFKSKVGYSPSVWKRLIKNEQ